MFSTQLFSPFQISPSYFGTGDKQWCEHGMVATYAHCAMQYVHVQCSRFPQCPNIYSFQGQPNQNHGISPLFLSVQSFEHFILLLTTSTINLHTGRGDMQSSANFSPDYPGTGTCTCELHISLDIHISLCWRMTAAAAVLVIILLIRALHFTPYPAVIIFTVLWHADTWWLQKGYWKFVKWYEDYEQWFYSDMCKFLLEYGTDNHKEYKDRYKYAVSSLW